MRPTHHHWSCDNCGWTKRTDHAVPYLMCDECGRGCDYDVDAELEEYDALMRDVGAGPECTVAG